MAYCLNSHINKLKQIIPVLGSLLLCQTPEVFVTILQKKLEMSFSSMPVFSILIIYPLFCILTSVSSALSFLVIQKTVSKTKTEAIFETLFSRFFLLSRASVLLGLISLLSTLAFVIPGIIVLAFYLFVPYLILTSQANSFWSFFSGSRELFRIHPILCLFSATTITALSLVSFWRFMDAPLVFEIGFSLFVSLIVNIWISTLFIEVVRK